MLLVNPKKWSIENPLFVYPVHLVSCPNHQFAYQPNPLDYPSCYNPILLVPPLNQILEPVKLPNCWLQSNLQKEGSHISDGQRYKAQSTLAIAKEKVMMLMIFAHIMRHTSVCAFFAIVSRHELDLQ
ncbi:hypothetical protein SLA2020_026860 [Shorea laevis]